MTATATTVLTCPHCDQHFRQPVAEPINCRCGATLRECDLQPGVRQPKARESATVPECPDRGEVIAKLSEEFGCGCQGVMVYRCNDTKELVTLRPVCDKGRQTLTIEWAEYHGRNCQECQERKVPVSKQPKQPQAVPTQYHWFLEDRQSAPRPGATVRPNQTTEMLLANLRIKEGDGGAYPIEVRNLLYHCCPLRANEGWRKATAQLLRPERMRLFNGRKVVAIATGPLSLLHQASVASKMFEGVEGIEILEISNDVRLREVASFLPLLERVANQNPNEATFYAHTKATSTAENIQGATRWRNMMFHKLLDCWSEVELALRFFPMCGTTLANWKNGRFQWPSKMKHVGDWMFCGTFFWFRHDEIFTHDKWRCIPNDRYGAEAWPSVLFPFERACSLYQPWPEGSFPGVTPYDPRYYPKEFDD